jgi:predicted metalloprotease with PDZ domain
MERVITHGQLPLPVSTDATVRYTVSMTRPNTHYFEVKIETGPKGKSRLRFIMPVWTPGSYLVREFSRNVIEFSARDAAVGRELKWYKDSKYSWLVETGGQAKVEVSYKVYAHEFTVDTSYLDDAQGIINGASVFMYVEGMQDQTLLLTLVPFGTWKSVSTGLQQVGTGSSGRRVYQAETFDILVDSPIEIGNQDIYDFEVGSVRHEVSISGLDRGLHQRLVGDIKKIVENTIPVIGEIPYERYVFVLNFSDDTSGGLEHLNSTHCILPRLRLQPEEEYRRALSLFSHEFFHTWNVKRMRPKGLGPFDYRSEVYTKSLWVAEGITSYYDNLILRRAGLISTGEYLDMLCEDVNAIASLPGPLFQSAEEASFDAWIRRYRPDENSPNVDSSYYNQGAVIGWMIDMEIRRNSGSSRSLDDVMRKVYRKSFKKGRAYVDGEFERACNDVAESDLSGIFEKRVRGRERIDLNRYFAYAGLKLVPKGKDQQRERGFLGVKLKTESGKTTVSTRLFGSPAEVAGIAAGDEILGADGMRLDGTTLPYFISSSKPHASVSFILARKGAIREVQCELGSFPVFEYRVSKLENASQEQKELYSKWLHEPWEAELKYPEYIQYPLRRKMFDYV